MTPRSAVILVAIALVVCTPAERANAYLKVGVTANGTTITLNWTTRPVRYFVSEVGVSNVTAGQLRDAVNDAFTTWHQVPSASIAFEFAGFTAAAPLDEDNTSTLGFEDRPELERTLAATNYVVDTRSGEILEADIFFNSAFPWSVAANGEPGRYDVQSIAAHEIGHFLGLGHSALGETELQPSGDRRLIASGAVMFPIAFFAGDISWRRLRPDDIAGVSDLYPGGTFRAATGILQGRVTKNGQGVFGAHVIAFSLRTGTLVAGFALDSSGTFAVAGLDPGSYIVRVEPLDDGNVGSFFDGGTVVDTDFRATYYPHLVTLPAGGSTQPITVAVSAK
jgi:hypothetical protein